MVDRSLIWIGRSLVVRYMRYKESYPAQSYLDTASPADRVRFLALARRLAEEGAIREHGHAHFLKTPYQQIYELKPPDSRVFGFFYLTSFYATNAGEKKKQKAQEADYERAEAMRQDFFEGLRKKRKGKG